MLFRHLLFRHLLFCFIKFFLYLFTSFPCKLCLNKSTIETYLKQVLADVATCWAQGYSLVVLYVFCQWFRKNGLCDICLLYKHSSQFTTDKFASYLSWLCFKLAKSHCLDTIYMGMRCKGFKKDFVKQKSKCLNSKCLRSKCLE